MAPRIDQALFPFEKVGITGGTGTVGSQFIKVLLAQCPHLQTINTTCRPASPRARRIPDDPRVNVVRGDITEPDLLRAVVDGGQIVYHLAAWLANVEMPSMTEVYLTNGLATGMVARLCAREGKPLVFTSSHSVYFAGEYEGRIRADEYVFRQDFLDWVEAVSGPYGRLIDGIIGQETGFEEAPEAIERIHAELPPPFEPKIYDSDPYHIYCLTKLLAERLVLDRGGVVLRLANVYGPGDESPQAVGEACQRLLEAEPGDELEVRQPFKKLVPAHLGDIIRCLIRAAGLRTEGSFSPLFTVASQETYMREDSLLRAVADALNRIRGTDHEYDIEKLPPEERTAFTYDLAKMRSHLLRGEPLTPFETGVQQQLARLMERAEGLPADEPALEVEFAVEQ